MKYYSVLMTELLQAFSGHQYKFLCTDVHIDIFQGKMLLLISVLYNSLYWGNISLMIYNTALDSVELLGLAMSAIIVSFLLPSIEYLLKVWMLNSTVFQGNLDDASNSVPETAST